MSATVADYYFAWNRKRNILVQLCGAIAIAIDVALFMFTPNLILRITSISLIFLYGGAMGYFLVRSSRERLGDLFPRLEEVLGVYDEERDPRAWPRLPFVDPFDSAAALPLETRIELAAEASVQFGRRVGVLCTKVSLQPDIEAEARRELLEFVAASLRKRVRATDHIEVLNSGEIIVCLNLLSSFTELEAIAARLTRVLATLDGLRGAGAAPFGAAIYPMHGYSGAELIEHARGMIGNARAPVALNSEPDL